MKRAKLAAVAVLALAALVVGAYLEADWTARQRLEAFETTLREGGLAERRRLATEPRPVLRGPPIEEDAAERYARVPPAFDFSSIPMSVRAALGKTVLAGPAAPIPPEVSQFLADRRDALALLREAARCTRSSFVLDPLANERSWKDHQSLLQGFPFGAREAGLLLIIEGHERFAAGDRIGSVERYLDAIRFGSDIERGGGIVDCMLAVSIEYCALDVLGAIVTGPRSQDDARLLAEVSRGLARLEDSLPSVAHAIKMSRFLYGPRKQLALEVLPKLGFKEKLAIARETKGLSVFAPANVVLADALAEDDDLFQASEDAATIEDHAKRTAAFAAIAGRAEASRNPLALFTPPIFEKASEHADLVLAKHRLVRTAIALEQCHARDGRYPSETDDRDLPTDPLAAPAKIRYRRAPDGQGFKLWCAGGDAETQAPPSPSDRRERSIERRSPDGGKR